VASLARVAHPPEFRSVASACAQPSVGSRRTRIAARSSCRPRVAPQTYSLARWRVRAGAAAGLHRFSASFQLAAHLAAPVLAARWRSHPYARLASEAVAARAVFDVRQEDDSAIRGGRGRAWLPACARTHAPRDSRWRTSGRPRCRIFLSGGPDLARLPAAIRRVLSRPRRRGRQRIFKAAGEGVAAVAGLPLLLLDVPFDSLSNSNSPSA
jgi:hypothetical protein